MKTSDTETDTNTHKADVFRDTWVRYMGYANEVGEAFRVQVHVNVVRFSYVVASGYVLADTAHKTRREYQSQGGRWNSSVAFACADTLVWQGLASVAVPGFTINRICWLTGLALGGLKALPVPARRWLVTGVGLGCIPFIVHPIDSGVHWTLDRSLRKLAPRDGPREA